MEADHLHLFTKKAGQGNDTTLHWLLAAVNDMVRNKMVDGTELSERGLSGKKSGGNGRGLLDLLLFRTLPASSCCTSAIASGPAAAACDPGKTG